MQLAGAAPGKILRNHDEYQRAMLAAWQNFIHSQQLDPVVPPNIAASWRRSWGRVNPNNEIEFTRMSSAYLLASQTASFELIAIARPVMEDVYQCVQNSGIVMVLTNSVGCVLDMLGDEAVLQVVERWGAGLGSILSEELIGTTSFGLALAERMPVQVAGSEHFIQQFHIATGAAAPMFDLTGRLLGVVGMVVPVERHHVHSLGLVVAAARAIECQRQSDFLMAEQNSHLAQLNAILSAISDGILVWNTDDVLVHANHAASEMLGIPEKLLLGNQTEALLTIPDSVRQAILERKPLADVEGVIVAGERTIDCLISLNFVFQNESRLRWVIVTLRPEKNVRKLVQRQVGATAVLTLDDIPGESVQVQRIRNFVRSVADAKASILIRGEVGTGKNALANAIHNASHRRDGPFIIFSCSSVPNELVISELLGYDENTGFARGGSRPSKFELADSGTLFFQDVDVLPLEAQSVLLNGLELGFIQRIGSRRPIEVNVHVIASTSARMETLLAQGSFRPDLYYRLSTFSITIPPLRERNRDIPLVADRILRRLSMQLHYPLLLGQGVIEVLKRYPWPGNVREMEAVLGRAATQVGKNGIIELSHLPSSLQYVSHIAPDGQSAATVQPFSEIKRETIIKAAQLYRGNVTQMARILGISRATLWRHLKALDINPGDYRQPPLPSNPFLRK